MVNSEAYCGTPRCMKKSGRPINTEKERLIALARRLTESSSSAERQRIKKELACMTFDGQSLRG
jgi:hypothetical protein